MRSNGKAGEPPPPPSSSSSKEMSYVIKHGTAKRTRVLRITGRTLLGLMILVAIAMIICWLIVFPRNPDIIVETGQVIPHSLTDRKLNATIAFTVTSYNPNKKASIRMDSMRMIVSDMGLSFWSDIPSFTQPPKNKTVLTSTIQGNFIYPFGHMKELMKLEGISPELRFSAKVSYIMERWTSRDRLVEVYCDSLRLKFNDSTVFDNKKCKVDL
ncbi:uncharacterized protein LOC101218532 [Cucumis sativus]|uniref:Late embryogenesis abundant protein LEA-2 subgroup domain-containing protein n=1 Tax=Cucumis sativus TaxID=3659 RepID=A0A0A0LSV0_CUCSA|nr:uncharacterized protein LOC101218532 [Cucumis sativus]KGN64868.1 hypothetical protein Csa_022755 [Cucumis sativus]